MIIWNEWRKKKTSLSFFKELYFNISGKKKQTPKYLKQKILIFLKNSPPPQKKTKEIGATLKKESYFYLKTGNWLRKKQRRKIYFGFLELKVLTIEMITDNHLC